MKELAVCESEAGKSTVKHVDRTGVPVQLTVFAEQVLKWHTGRKICCSENERLTRGGRLRRRGQAKA